MTFTSQLLSAFRVLLLLAPLPAAAHHAFAAQYSRDLPISVTGMVTKVEWMNPHARFYVDQTTEDGKVINWDFELGTPNVLMRRGWTRNSLKVGDVVSVEGFRARNDPLVGNANSVELADGTKVFAGSSVEDD